MPDKRFKHCQSCGMPLRRDEAGGGTNGDGSKSSMYCSHCYQRGEFTMPDITVEQMRERVRAKLKEFGFPAIAATLMTGDISRLRRWRSETS